ncbi:MAG: class I SAM-dependent methyltransferase [Mycobacterium sp.]
MTLMCAAAPSSQPQPRWLINEVASAGRENLDPAHAARYDGKEDANAAAEVQLLQRVGIGSGSTIVDLGAGTGQFALAVAPHCARVVAVDVSPVMLRVLREKVATAGTVNIDIVEAGFLTYQHSGPPADAVYSRYALHHLPDAWKAIALVRMHDMLRRGGVLRLQDVVYNFEPQQAEDRIEAWCATGADGVIGEWSRAELEDHVRDEHSTFTWLLEPMIARAGFSVEQADHTADGIVASYILRRH